MKKWGNFFKRNKVTKDEGIPKVNAQQIEIQIEGDIGLFKDEKEKIMEGAKQLLELGKAEDMEDAIITFATMFRGVRFREIKDKEDGTRVVIFRETAQGKTKMIAADDEIGDR